MSIVSSEIVEDRPQIDGRRSIIERHVDHLGVAELVHYLAESGADVSAVMLARVAAIEARLQSAEIVRNIARVLAGDPPGSLTFSHSTVAENEVALRAFYQTATQLDVGRIAAFLLQLSDARLRSLFSMTQQQVNQLRTRLQARVDAMNAVLGAVGE